MRRELRYLLILAPIAVIIALSILIRAPVPNEVVAQPYIVGGELETPQISKSPDYTPYVVAAGAAVALIVGIIVASRLRAAEAE